MDFGDERVSREDPLRGLFQELGRHPAPSGLKDRVMARIDASPVPSVQSLPLIGRSGWWALAALVFTMAIVAFTLPTGPLPTDTAGTWFTTTMHGSLDLLSSRWAMGSLLCAAGLLLLDNWVSARPLVEPSN